MRVWFAIRTVGYEDDAVFGPFAGRRTARDFIEKDEDNNRPSPWWNDDWYIAEIEIAERWEDGHSLTHFRGKKYRSAYCETMRREEYKQWRKDNPERAAIEDECWKRMKEALINPPKPANIMDSLQFGQEIEVKITRDGIIKLDN